MRAFVAACVYVLSVAITVRAMKRETVALTSKLLGPNIGMPKNVARAFSLKSSSRDEDSCNAELFYYLNTGWTGECFAPDILPRTVHTFGPFFVICRDDEPELYLCSEGTISRPSDELTLLTQYTLQELCLCEPRSRGGKSPMDNAKMIMERLKKRNARKAKKEARKDRKENRS